MGIGFTYNFVQCMYEHNEKGNVSNRGTLVGNAWEKNRLEVLGGVWSAFCDVILLIFKRNCSNLISCKQICSILGKVAQF